MESENAKLKKIYVCGAIQAIGLEQARENFKRDCIWLGIAFPEAELVNPMELPHEEGDTRAIILQRDIAALMDCDAIYVREGWQHSAGCQLEHLCASNFGKTIIYGPSAIFWAHQNINNEKLI